MQETRRSIRAGSMAGVSLQQRRAGQRENMETDNTKHTRGFHEAAS